MEDKTPDDIQKQIDEMKEQVSKALSIVQTAEETIDIIASRVSTLEEETKTSSNARDTPDSEGFWRDTDGDIWACDNFGNVRLITSCDGPYYDGNYIYDMSFNYYAEGFGPFTKIDNPFLKRAGHIS